MSKQLPSFLPENPPTTSILDFSNSLSPDSINALNQVASSVTYKPVVVVLPKDYTGPDAQKLTIQLAKKWDMDGAGKNLLIVVDLSGHKVRAHGSPGLNQSGITSDYISNSLIPNQFIPYMRKGDLTTAVRLTLLDVDHVQSAAKINDSRLSSAANNASPSTYTTSSTSASTNANSASSTDDHGAFPIFLGVMVIVVLLSAVFVTKGKQNSNRKQWQELMPDLDALYRRADQLGEAAEFLDPAKNQALSHEIADFFAKLTTVQKSQAQVEKLSTSMFKAFEAGKALERFRQYIEIMTATSSSLLKRLNALTGGINSYEADGTISASVSGRDTKSADFRGSVSSKDSSNKAAAGLKSTGTNTAYRAPTWISEPAYSREVNDDGLLDISRFLAMEQMQRASDREAQQSVFGRSYSHRRSDSSDGGRSWSSSNHDHSRSSSSDSSSSSSSSDGGGSWDSSSSSSSSDSSSSSSSDGGGSW